MKTQGKTLIMNIIHTKARTADPRLAEVLRRDQQADTDEMRIRRARARLVATPGYARWFEAQPWRLQNVIYALPYNLYYSLPRGPFPAQLLSYCEQNQLVTLNLFIHSPHSPRVVFDVQPAGLRPYRCLPKDWQLLIGSTWPPLYDIGQLPPQAFEAHAIGTTEQYSHKRQRSNDSSPLSLRSLGRAALWLLC